jgi:hypothetical protein
MLSASGEVIGPDRYRQRGYVPETNSWLLVITLTNAGAGPATSVRVDPAPLERVGPIAPGLTAIARLPADPIGQAQPIRPAAETVVIEYGGIDWVGGTVELRRDGQAWTWSETRRVDPTRADA